MSAPAVSGHTPSVPPTTGAAKAATLLRALGPEAQAVWSALTPEEAHLISEQMRQLPPLNPGSAERTLAALLSDSDVGGAEALTLEPGSTWHRIEQVSPHRLASFLEAESAQVAAIVLSRLSPSHAGQTVRALPEEKALDILHRMVALTPPSAAVLHAIETGLAPFLENGAEQSHGVQHVAQVFEAMGETDEPGLLDAFAKADANSASEVRRIMVPFSSIAAFSPAGIQTLLANVNHDTLALALKGAPADLLDAVCRNMTQRAATILQEDMDALGSVPRKDVERARMAIVSTARMLIDRGDIRPAGQIHDEDLVE